MGNTNRPWVQPSAWLEEDGDSSAIGGAWPVQPWEHKGEHHLALLPVPNVNVWPCPCIQASGDYLGIVLKDRRVQWVYKLGDEEPASLTVDEDIGEQFATISINRWETGGRHILRLFSGRLCLQWMRVVLCPSSDRP